MRRIRTMAGKKEGGRTSKAVVRISITLVVIAAVTLGLCTAFLFFWYSHPFDGESGEISDSIVEDVENVVEEKPQQVNVLVCGTDESGTLTDVIMLVMIDAGAGKINILQIPRDTYVNVGTTGKINAAYAQGDKDLTPVNRLVKIINEQFRLPVHHYGVISLSAFRNIVDTMGGIPINLPREIVFEPDKILPEGEQVLDGTRAEWFVRHRSSYATGDIGRLQAQRLFLNAAVRQAKTMDVSTLISLAPTAFSEVASDLSVAETVGYIGMVYGIDIENISLYLLPGEGTMHNGQSVWSVHAEAAAELLNENFRPYSEDIPASELPIIELVNSTDYFDNTEEHLKRQKIT